MWRMSERSRMNVENEPAERSGCGIVEISEEDKVLYAFAFFSRNTLLSVLFIIM